MPRHTRHRLFLLLSLLMLGTQLSLTPERPTPISGHAAPQGIIGGQDAPEDAFPWMVALIPSWTSDPLYDHFCGGSLIHPQYVLTAAHCVMDGNDAASARSVDVIVGAHRLSQRDGKRASIVRVIIHPDYDDAELENDVALLKLAVPIRNSPTLVSIASEDEILETNPVQAVVTGWGENDGPTAWDRLNFIDVPLMTQAPCKEAVDTLARYINDTTWCLKDPAGKQAACFGDSGGPLLIRSGVRGEWIQIGVASWVYRGCAQENSLSVYTRIASYLDWIEETVAIDSRPVPTEMERSQLMFDQLGCGQTVLSAPKAAMCQ